MLSVKEQDEVSGGNKDIGDELGRFVGVIGAPWGAGRGEGGTDVGSGVKLA